MSPEREPFANPDLVCGSNSNKVRIIALYIQYREGVPEEDRRRLYQHARLTRPEMDAVNALVHLGVRITRVRPAHSLTISDAVRSQYAWFRGQETKTSNGASGRNSLLKMSTSSRDTNLYSAPSSRYAGFLSLLVFVSLLYAYTPQDQVSGKLDPAAFPYVKDYPQAAPAASSARPTPTPTTSLRSAKPSWHRAARTGGAVAETRQRVLVFVAGGMTYSEMREAYVLSSQLGKDVIIGACACYQCRLMSPVVD